MVPVLFGGQTPAYLLGWLRLKHGAYETWGSSGQYTRLIRMTLLRAIKVQAGVVKEFAQLFL